jgi:predicted amidophosphoribosyltransferase
MATCPNCGADIEPDADFCETCHHYIRTDVCSFCGCHLTGNEAFCPECGSPRGGIVCPVCHTLNNFSFCKQCGTALTEEARELLAELQMTPEYKEMQQLANELQQLDM